MSAPLSNGSVFDPAKLYVWVKSLESKVNSLLREVDVLKNGFMARNNKLTKEMSILSQDLVNIKHQQEKTDQKMDLIIQELRQTAGIEEVKILQKYVEFWNPMHFATQKDLEKLNEVIANGKL